MASPSKKACAHLRRSPRSDTLGTYWVCRSCGHIGEGNKHPRPTPNR